MQTNRAICILYALTGNFDAPGGNAIFPKVPLNPITGNEFLPPDTVRKRLGLAERPLGPASTGAVQAYEVYKAVLTGKPYPIKAFVSIGGNILMANGDSKKGREALKQLEFYVQADLFETPAARLADILLPAATLWEGFHVRTSFERGPSTSSYLQLRKEVILPLYECWPDMKIIFELAKRMGFADKFWNGNIEAAFNYQLKPSDVTVENLRDKPGGIFIPLPVKYKKYAEKPLDREGFRGFNTPSRKIEIYSKVFKEHGYDPLPVYKEPSISPVSRPDLARNYPLILTNAKVLPFCHGQHRAVPQLRELIPHPYLEINPKKAEELGIRDGDWVMVETIHGSIKIKASLTDRIALRVVCTQHGWWQACPSLGLPGYDPYSSEGANVNLLVSNDDIDPISGSVPHRSYQCNVKKV